MNILGTGRSIAMLAFFMGFALTSVDLRAQSASPAALVMASQKTPEARASLPRARAYVGTYVLPSGSRIVVEEAGKGLTVSAVGQEALYALDLVQEKDQDRLDRLNDQARRIMEEVQRGGMEELVALVPKARRDVAKRDLGQYFGILRGTYGKLLHFDVLGTVPIRRSLSYTFVLAQYQQREQLFRISWNGEALVTVKRDLPEPFQVYLRPVDEKRFVRTNWHNGEVSWFTFEADPSGTLRLSLASDRGRVTAKRDASVVDAAPAR